MKKVLVTFRIHFKGAEYEMIEPVHLGNNYYEFKCKRFGVNRYLLDDKALALVNKGKFVIDLYKGRTLFL